MLTSLNFFFTDHMWHNNTSDYSQAKANVISVVAKSTPIVNQGIEITS